MIYIVPFVGNSTDATIAEVWCATQIQDGYYRQPDGADQYEFGFLNPFEAQRFRDSYRDNSKPIRV